MPLQHFPNEGTEPCRGYSATGRPCGKREIEGLEFCLNHVPDDLLEEAEEITGMRRCRYRFGEQDACRTIATPGTEPPACKNHGANPGSVTSAHAARRVVEGKATDRLAEIMTEHGDKLLNPVMITNPLEAHLELVSEAWALKEILRVLVSRMFSQDRIRYAHDRVGEQLRMEILLYERSLERIDRMLRNIENARIDDRLAGIEERKVAAIERALVAALEASGLDIDGQGKAVKVLRRELKAIPA